MKTEIAQEGMKAAPPVAVTAATWMDGVTLNEMVLIATLVYIAMQMAYLAWKWWREIKKYRRG